MVKPVHYWGKRQVAEYIGAKDASLSGVHLPPWDAAVGTVNADGSIPRGTTLGWRPETIIEWDKTRIKRPRKSS